MGGEELPRDLYINRRSISPLSNTGKPWACAASKIVVVVVVRVVVEVEVRVVEPENRVRACVSFVSEIW